MDRTCLMELGLSAAQADRAEAFCREGNFREALLTLRSARGELMEELHGCQRRLDALDLLIRETEKQKGSTKS